MSSKTITFPNGDSAETPVLSSMEGGEEFATAHGRTVRYHTVARRDATTHVAFVDNITGEEVRFVNDYEFFAFVD